MGIVVVVDGVTLVEDSVWVCGDARSSFCGDSMAIDRVALVEDSVCVCGDTRIGLWRD